jgi:hypothetical protein
MGEVRSIYKISSKKPQGRSYLGHIGTDEKITLTRSSGKN